MVVILVVVIFGGGDLGGGRVRGGGARGDDDDDRTRQETQGCSSWMRWRWSFGRQSFGRGFCGDFFREVSSVCRPGTGFVGCVVFANEDHQDDVPISN